MTTSISRLVTSLALCLGFALAVPSMASAGGAANLSQKSYAGPRRATTAANGGAAYFLNRKPGLAQALGLKAIKSRNIKVTEIGRTMRGSSTNITFLAETLQQIDGKPAASTTVVVTDRAVTGPSGGMAREARFFARPSADGRVKVNPKLGL
jgi:hypothetical protein